MTELEYDLILANAEIETLKKELEWKNLVIAAAERRGDEANAKAKALEKKLPLTCSKCRYWDGRRCEHPNNLYAEGVVICGSWFCPWAESGTHPVRKGESNARD